MFLCQIDLTTALRPSLLPDESLLFVQDAVGLYEGKLKVPGYQNGHAYLTTHRACYIDNDEPRKKAVAISLKDVERADISPGFLKSSPKVTLYAKASKNGSLTPRLSTPALGRSNAGSGSVTNSPSPNLVSNATWICSICSFSNPVPSNFDPVLANESTPLPPCLACGIKPTLALVVKATIASIANRSPSTAQLRPPSSSTNAVTSQAPGSRDLDSINCPRCTFRNHSSLLSCEICGASLGSKTSHDSVRHDRTASPGPFSNTTAHPAGNLESVKFSFRVGGDKIFLERVNGALTQRKWLLQGAPAVPKPGFQGSTSGSALGTSPKTSHIGITGLERRGTELRRNNEVVIGNAFEDLAALMASAKEIIALAEQFASQTKASSSTDTTSASPPGPNGGDPAALLAQLNLSTTKEMLGGSNSSNSLYLTELSRQLAEYLTDDRTGILRLEGGIISLVDLWAIFNVARGGVELVSPTDFADAVGLFEKLQLPVRLRRFRSGLLVVQGIDRTDAKTVQAILGWLKGLREVGQVEQGESEDVQWGRGVTALQTAERFGWSVGVATEELEMAEDRGALCREVGLEGVKFWENWLAGSNSVT